MKRFNNAHDFRYYIIGIMEAMNVNLAIVELQVTLNNKPIFIKGHYKLFVTKEKGETRLKFFSIKTGIHYKWFTDPLIGDIELIAVHNIAEYDIAEYVDRQEDKGNE